MTIDITIPVPDDRVAEFYQFFSNWLDGTLVLPVTSPKTSPHTSPQSSDASAARGGAQDASSDGWLLWGNTDADLADAVTLWRKYPARSRAMFSLLMDNPGVSFSGDEIAEKLNIPNGSRGVAGVLAWPARKSKPMRRGLPTEFDDKTDPDRGVYFMPPERAELFKAAREQVEGKA